LGGDSILSIRLASAIKSELNVSIPISIIVQDRLSIESIETLVKLLQTTGEDLHEMQARKRITFILLLI
jgi:acyl carrier protein